MTNNAGIGIDVSCGGYPFEEQAVRRARKVQFVPGIRLRVCTAEDLIVLKAFANRAIDWFDIEGVIVKQRKRKLDLQYVFNQLGPLALLKEEPEILPKLQALIDECE
jgi:predicted nucleotidyltransferase